jgi:hypothetical protein
LIVGEMAMSRIKSSKITDEQLDDWLKANKLNTIEDVGDHMRDCRQKLESGDISLRELQREVRYTGKVLRRFRAQLRS